MKASSLLLCLWIVSTAVCAEATDSCAGLADSALNECRVNQQILRQQQLEQLLQQQQDRQNELDKQQREIRQQLESMRVENQSLREQLRREPASQTVQPVATHSASTAELKSWKSENPWFGSDYVKTQFAMRYLKQLQQERPDLAGRELLDALSMKVNETYAARH
jgi:septal ring factor EnvC (AmiA/AmiB activator)